MNSISYEDKLNSYVWKKRKVIVDKDTITQEKVKMMDMTEDELTSARKHCINMLYNDSKFDPGRFIVLEEITNQINNCNTELAIRWFLSLTSDDKPVYTRFSLLNQLNEKLAELKENNPDIMIFRLKDVYDGLPIDYQEIDINSVIKGCKYLLGKFNRKHITTNFILKQGIWFTKQEIDDFNNIEKLKSLKEIIFVIKERLGIKQSYELPIKSTGLNYSQFRAMINLKVNKKYSDLTTTQLETLKSKILFILEEDIHYHIQQWQNLISQIEEVAAYKGYNLK